MKLLIIACSFLISQFAFNQNGTVKVEKPDDFLPRIAGRAGGEISRFYLCDSEGITIGYDSKVVSFVLYALDASNQEIEVEIQGNSLTEEYCKLLLKVPEGGLVYFQEIMVESRGIRVKVSSMMFEVKDED